MTISESVFCFLNNLLSLCAILAILNKTKISCLSVKFGESFIFDYTYRMSTGNNFLVNYYQINLLFLLSDFTFPIFNALYA